MNFLAIWYFPRQFQVEENETPYKASQILRKCTVAPSKPKLSSKRARKWKHFGCPEAEIITSSREMSRPYKEHTRLKNPTMKTTAQMKPRRQHFEGDYKILPAAQIEMEGGGGAGQRILGLLVFSLLNGFLRQFPRLSNLFQCGKEKCRVVAEFDRRGFQLFKVLRVPKSLIWTEPSKVASMDRQRTVTMR